MNTEMYLLIVLLGCAVIAGCIAVLIAVAAGACS